MYAIVAGSVAHAKALIKWAKLDEEKCVPVVYGQDLKNMYERAVLVRPTEGVDETDQEWIVGKLIPRVANGDVMTHPACWKPYHDTNQQLIAGNDDAPQLEENPLWA